MTPRVPHLEPAHRGADRAPRLGVSPVLPGALALAATLVLALPAAAQSNAAMQRELRDLQQRTTELEARLKAAEAAAKAAEAAAQSAEATGRRAAEASGKAAADKPAPGMTADQAAEFNRIKLKTESLEDGREESGFKNLKISGMMDPTFIYTRTATGSFAFLGEFSGNGGDLSFPNDGFGYANSYFGQAMIDFQKETDDGTRWRLTLAPQKNASSGYNVRSIVHEATVSMELPGSQNRWFVGQVPDWSGYEYVWSHQQPLITHNLLFDFTVPSFYQGIGTEVSAGDWTLKGLIGNLNASRFDRDNRAPVITYRGDYSAGEFSGFGLAGQHGKSFGSRIDLFEVDAYTASGSWNFAGQIGIGRLRDGAANGDAKWSGLSALASYAFTPRLKASARLDYVRNSKNGGGIFGQAPGECELPERDPAGVLTGNTVTGACADGLNGFGPAMVFQDDSQAWEPDASGKGVNRHALSLGLSYVYGQNTTLKAELRRDGASGNAFLYPDGSYRRKNHLLGASVVVSF